jgi:hypothetical protein
MIDGDNQASFSLIITNQSFDQAFSTLLSQPFQFCPLFTGPNT